MDKKIIVLAGNREQFENYLDEKGLTDSEARYCFEQQSFYGFEPTQIEIVGTFWDRKDAIELQELAQTRLSQYK